jgi:hypothetical protein
MLLGFKRRFALFVWEGSKTHTIRNYGNRRAFRIGDRCDCYVDPRHKTMALLGRWECVKVEDIRIDSNWQVWIEGQKLSGDERNALALRDGFRDWQEQGFESPFLQMMAFWSGRLPFHGQIIHWKYNEATRATRLPQWMKAVAA